ncbi:hypothetical protein PAMP_016655 [Pampus punctatissimus]
MTSRRAATHCVSSSPAGQRGQRDYWTHSQPRVNIPLHKSPPAKQNPLSEDDTKHQPAGHPPPPPPPPPPPSFTALEQTHQ